MRYAPDVLTPHDEQALLEQIPALAFKEFEFHGFLGKRRTVSFGWHKDRPFFGAVIGLSLRSRCPSRLRRKAGAKWERRSFAAAPRSAYLLRGPSRTAWEHSIPPLDTLRYSVTFRSLTGGGRPAA